MGQRYSTDVKVLVVGGDLSEEMTLKRHLSERIGDYSEIGRIEKNGSITVLIKCTASESLDHQEAGSCQGSRRCPEEPQSAGEISGLMALASALSLLGALAQKRASLPSWADDYPRSWRSCHEKVRRDVSWPPQRLPCEKARRHAFWSEKRAAKRAKHPKRHGPFATYDSAHYQRSGR